MAINEPTAVRRHKKDRSSIGSKTPLTFHQKKGKFAGGTPRSNPDHLDRIRKDALEDFSRATVKRKQSVHQMVAMYGSNGSDKGDIRRLTTADEGGNAEVAGGRGGTPIKTTRSLSRSKGVSGHVRSNSDWAGMRSPKGQLEGMVRDKDLTRDDKALNGQTLAADGEGSSVGLSPAHPPHELLKFESFSNPSATDLRALEFKKLHLDEALKLTSHRRGNVKDIAKGFKGESRPENVEIFHKRHKEEEAAYRYKVHEGKETLKKTSQVTDAMYNFVLKLNLATTEGKERFMRRWAVGRIANGESTTPREGWKFLQSLGIDIDKKENPDREAPNVPGTPLVLSRGWQSTVATPGRGWQSTVATPGRGRGQGWSTPRRRGSHWPTASAEDSMEQETSAWEEALSRAVGGLVRGGADACAPTLRTQ